MQGEQMDARGADMSGAQAAAAESGGGVAAIGMLDEDATRARVLAQIEPLPAEWAPLRGASGRFAGADIVATLSLPRFDNSAMDGYAVESGERGLERGTRLMVTGEQPAGADRGLRVGAGEAVRIFTGAPVPAGAGAVVMQEDVDRDGAEIVLRARVEPGEFIRRTGADVARGQRLIARGEKLTPQRIGLLASQGMARVEVCRRARVAILATGDELRPPGETLAAGEIYESNSALLAALTEPLGAEVNVIGHARDERADLDAKVAAGLRGHDVLIVAGGVSVGEHDLVKASLAGAGVRLDVWRVRVQPGKPFLYGAGRGTHVFGLPGNPVSAFVTFLLFVRPALLKLMGGGDHALALPSFPAVAGRELAHGGNRPHYVRGFLDAQGTFAPAGRQESHAIFGLSRSNALVRLEPGSRVAAGEPVRAFVWE